VGWELTRVDRFSMVCGYVGAINCRLSQLMCVYLFEYHVYYPSIFLNYWYIVGELNVSLHFFPWSSTCAYFRALINSFYLCSRLFRQANRGTRSKHNLVSLQRSKVGISATHVSTSLVTKIYLKLAYWMVESPTNKVLLHCIWIKLTYFA